MSRTTRNPLIIMLCYDQDKNIWSNTKAWANIGYAIMCYTFVYEVMMGNASTELWLVFGGLVIGNRTLNKFLNNRKGASEEPPSSINQA